MSKIGMFNKSFWAMRQDLKHGNGLAFSIFGGQHVKNTDKQAILDLNTQLQNGVKPGKAWARTMTNCSIAAQEQTKQCLKTKGSLKELANGLNDTSVASKAAEVGMKALSIAGNMLLMWGISEVITGISKLASAANDIRESAKEIGSSFNETKSDIEDYKAKIKELQTTINDSSSSIADVTEARKNLMLIQDELISKYGSETDTINIITDAINNQSDALDDLSKKKYIESKNDFNKEDFFENISNNFDGYSDNMDRMVSEMEESLSLNLTTAFNRNGEEYKKFEKIISQYGTIGTGNIYAGGNGIDIGTISLDGGLDNIYEKLLKIQEAASHYDFGSNDFNEYLTNIINKSKEKLDDYSALYNNYVLYDKILSDSGKSNGYDGAFKNITDAYNKYKKEAVSGDEESVKQAQDNYAKLFTETIENIDDNSVIEYFKNMYPELKEIVGSWQFEIDFSNNTDNIKADVQEAANKLKKDGFTVESLADFNSETATQKQIENYSILEAAATKYHMTVEDLISLLEKMGLIQTDSYKQLALKFGEENVKTLSDEDLEIAYTIKSTGDMTFDQLKTKIDEVKKQAEETSSTPLTFKEVWDSIGKSGDEEADKKALEAKEKLLELAKAGKLTEKELKSSFLADEFTKAGVSIEKATKKINKFAEEAKQLSALRTGIKSITSAYDEKKDSKKKVVSASTLDSMGDTLGVSDWGEKNQKVWENYKNVAADGKKSLADLKKAQDELATSYVNSNNFLANLDETNQDYYKGLLTEMGITNADSIVTAKLAEQKGIAEMETHDLSKMTSENINKLIEERGETDNARAAMRKFALEKVFANGKGLDTKSDILQLRNLVSATGVATTALSEYYRYKNGEGMGTGGGIDPVKQQEILKKNAEKEVKNAEKKLDKLSKLDTTTSKGDTSNDKGKDKGGKKDKTKKEKQTFDWMERRFKNLQNVIDFTASKLQNLFSVKAKNSNLNKQIKTTTKLINEYGIAAKKYQQKADQVAAASTKTVKGKNGKKKKVKTKALSKDIIQKIQTGKFTKKTKLSSLITEYGQSTAERIQSYIDYYDKAQDAKKNKQDQKAKKREFEQQKNQNYVDLYDSRTARAEAKEAIQTNAKDKNKAVDTQLKNTKLSYQYQIEIANLTENKAEAEKLQYEQEKKIAELKLKQIQNLQDEYDKIVGLIDNDAQDIDNAISLAQARGQTLSAGYYQRLNRLQTTKRQEAVNEKSKVEAALAAALKDGSIKKESDEWYEVQSTLQGLENTINECDVAIAENTTAIRELHTTMLEEMAENAKRMNTEADFLANLLSRKDLTDSDTGTFTNAGLGTLGTYGINMETAQAQMRELEKERAILEQMKKTGSLDYGDNGKHKYDSINQLEDAYNDILDKQQEWTQNEYDAEQKIIDLMKQYYQAQLDYMKEIIDAKKTALDYEKDLYNYQKSLAEKTKSIATLEKQAAALKGDNSEEGRARLAKIQLSLDEANQDLQDTEYDRYISDQQNMLDNMYSEYEDLMNHLFKDTDKLLQEGIEVINKNGELIESIFNKTAADYNYNYSDRFGEITKAFTESDKIVTGIKDSINGKEDSAISKKLETINTTIENKYDPPSSDGGGGDKDGGGGGGDPKLPAPTSGGTTQQTQTKNGQTTVTPSAMNKIEGTNEKLKNLRKALNSMKGAGFEKYWTLKSGTPKSYINQRIAAEPNYDKVYPNGKRSPQILTEKGLKLLAKKLGVKYPASGSVKTAELNKYVKDAHFQTGGIVRANGVPLKGDNIPIRVNPNETVLTQDFTDVLPMAVDVMDQFVKAAQPNYNALPNSNVCSQSIGDIVIHAELPNVENAQGFVYALQNDSKVQKAFAIATKDLMSKGRITKNIQSVQ